MSYLAPDGPVYQAGTLSGNPLAMAAGLAMLKALDQDEGIFERLADKTKRLHIGIDSVLSDSGLPYQINRLGSMISVHFTDQAVTDFETAAHGNNNFFKNYFHGMLKQGIYLPPSAFESYFLNDALSVDDIDQTIEALNLIVKKI
jgi:glutamate-1-semialdehyde 2,1-aminomutase